MFTSWGGNGCDALMVPRRYGRFPAYLTQGRTNRPHPPQQLRPRDLVPLACGRGPGTVAKAVGVMELYGTRCYRGRTLGGATHVVGFSSKGV